MMSSYTGQSVKQQNISYWFMMLLSFIFILNLSACGGGGDSSQSENGVTGQVLVALTDAEGDFVTYTVDVTSIKLTHAMVLRLKRYPFQHEWILRNTPK